jgi:hypothetical protein
MIVKARIDKLPKNKYKVINDVENIHQTDKGKAPSIYAGQTTLFKRYIVSNGINVRRLFEKFLFITRTSAHCLCFATIVKIVGVSRSYRDVFELEDESVPPLPSQEQSMMRNGQEQNPLRVHYLVILQLQTRSPSFWLR